MSSEGCVVVTGAGSGIGRGTAQYLTDHGWVVVGFDQAWPEDATGYPQYIVDVTDERSVAESVARANDEVGSIAGLVTCAGIIRVGDPLEFTAADFRKVMDVNVTGTFLAAQACGKVMAERGGGSIVTVASVSGLLAAPHRAAYSASKGAVIALTKSLAFDLAERGVRVNAIAPGSVRTPLLAKVQTPELRQSVLSCVPMNRLGEPEEIAAVAAFLLGDDAAFVTGQTWAVDGGQSIQAGWRIPEAVE